MQNITSYKRVKMALEHKEPDRVPFEIGATGVTGININALRKLKRLLGLTGEPKINDLVCQTGKVEEELINALNIDVKLVKPGPSNKRSILEKYVWEDSENYKLIDEFGIGWRMPKDKGHFYDIYHSPLKDFEEIEDITNYTWPDATDMGRYTNLKSNADKIVNEEGRAYVLGRMSAGMWETAMWMTGYEKFFCDMYINEKLIHAIMEKMLEVKMKYWERALNAVGENVLVISTADDLASQNNLLCSLDMYKKLIWPYHKQLFNFIKAKAKTDVYIFYHCDGACREAIPLLIEAGVDILNPIQVNCPGMDTKDLKKEFGKDISFWGALCDSQDILPYGTVEHVKEETKRRVEDCMKDGGWIAAPIHNILAEVPPENIIAMRETLDRYGRY